MSNTILVIGASGFLGRRLATIRTGGKVVGTYNQHPISGLEFLDLRDPLQLKRFLNRFQPSVVLYAAGLTDVDACERNPNLAWRLNAEAASEMASFCGVKMVYFSTDYVFDGIRGRYRENEEPTPLNVYGRTKLAGERAVLNINPGNIVVRVSGLYDSIRIKGQDFSKPFQSTEPIEADDTRLSCPVHVEDVVSAVRLLLESNGGVYHVAGPDVLSRYEFYQLAALRFPNMPSVTPSSASSRQGAPRPQDSSLRTDRINSLGWRARRVCDVFSPFPTENERSQAASEDFQGVGRNIEALLIDCVGGLLTSRTWLPKDEHLAEIDQACADVTDGPAFWQATGRAFGLNGTELLVLQERIAFRYTPNPPVWNNLKTWRTRFRLALVNNGSSSTFRCWVRKYGLDRVFDVLANSEEMGLRKPDSDFFLRVAEQLHTAPDRCVLIDDDLGNIKGAQNCGMLGLQTHEVRGYLLSVHIWDKSTISQALLFEGVS